MRYTFLDEFGGQPLRGNSIARLDGYQNDVRVKRRGFYNWMNVNSDLEFGNADTVFVGDNSKAFVTFNSNVEIEISENTVVIIREDEGIIDINLIKGELYFNEPEMNKNGLNVRVHSGGESVGLSKERERVYINQKVVKEKSLSMEPLNDTDISLVESLTLKNEKIIQKKEWLKLIKGNRYFLSSDKVIVDLSIYTEFKKGALSLVNQESGKKVFIRKIEKIESKMKIYLSKLGRYRINLNDRVFEDFFVEKNLPLKPPLIKDEQNLKIVKYKKNKAIYSMNWSKVKNARGYIFELYKKNQNGKKTLIKKKHTMLNYLEWEEESSGVFYCRISSLDRWGQQGLFSGYKKLVTRIAPFQKPIK